MASRPSVGSAVEDGYAGCRVLVTGGLGFIGSHLAKRLVELGARVTVVDSLIPDYGGSLYNVREIFDRIKIEFSDVRDSRAMREMIQGQELIFNLAGQVSHLDSMEDPETDLEINCRSQLLLLEACRAINPDVRIVFAASRQQYGRPKAVPVTEDHLMTPVDVNGINLVAGEGYHLLYNAVYGIRTVSLRLTNTYGPHLLMKHARQGFIAAFVRRAIEGKTIEVFGDGSQLRDFTYVSDAAEAFLRVGVTELAYGRAFNVGGAGPTSLLEVARLCQDLADKGGTVETVPWPAGRLRIDVGSIYLDHSALTEATGWTPAVSLRDGLAETISFYEAHGTHYWS